MNTADSLEYRYIELTDDLEEAGRLLFYTDAFIYPSLFGSADNAAKVMAKAIRQGSYCFAKETIFGAFCENKPAAILCKNPGGECKWNEQEWKQLFREAGIELPHTFDHAAKHYFQPMNAEKLEEYIEKIQICGEDRQYIRFGGKCSPRSARSGSWDGTVKEIPDDASRSQGNFVYTGR